MNFTIVFVTILLGVLLPGHFFRYLYFPSEHKNQIGTFKDLAGATAKNIIPGTIFFAITFIIYGYCYDPIDMGYVIDTLRDWWEPNFRFKYDNGQPLSKIISNQLFLFVCILYAQPFFWGLIFKLGVRYTSLDTRLSLIEYHNKWSYLFNSSLYRSANFNALRKLKPNEMLTLVLVDVKVQESESVQLYSGVYVDYVLSSSNVKQIESLILKQTSRWYDSSKKEIPGDLFVIDAKNILNYNFYYVIGEREQFRMPAWLSFLLYICYLAFFVTFFIFFFITSNSIFDWINSTQYFSITYLSGFVLFLVSSQIITYLLPFKILTKESPAVFRKKGVSDYKKEWQGSSNLVIGFFTILLFIELIYWIFLKIF